MAKRTPKPVCIDFETDKIEGRPFYPPKPVGVSIKYPGEPAIYYAWGHATDNICDLNYALVALRKAWKHKGGILCHNAKFDLDVAEVHLGLPMPSWDRIHETMFLLFLDNPHRMDLGLKPAAESLLGMKPDERDVVADWLIEHQPVEGVKITLRTSKTSKAAKEAIRQGRKPQETAAGAYISFAPGTSIVGPYANGDTERTAAIFDKLYPSIVERGMLGAYDRERKLMPILLDMERRGLRVDTARLASDVAMYRSWEGRIDTWLRKRLRVGVDVNLDSDADLLAAMEARGVVDTSLMSRTEKTGKVQMTKDSMAAGVSDQVLAAVLKYRTQLATCMKIFMLPWLEQAQVSGGLIFTNWNQTRGERGGARTGRLSSSPPFMNIPKEFAPLWAKANCPWNDLPDLPLCRGYIIPMEPDHVLMGRDYCFSGDTEVLTSDGFIRFDRLDKRPKVAQWWPTGLVDYVKPTAYQKVESFGCLTRIVGDRSCDLLVTPTHGCMVVKEGGEIVFRQAHDYPLGHHKQVHAGIFPGAWEHFLSTALFAAALQADGTVKAGGDRLVWKLKKQRKRDRLKALFDVLGLSYAEVPLGDQVTVTTRASSVPHLTSFIDLQTKTFDRNLIKLVARDRLKFLEELAWWDGRRNGDEAWAYFSTNVVNVDLVSEMSSVTGLRANVTYKTLKSGKTFGTVNMRRNLTTWTDTYRIEDVPYGGIAYCVSVPSGVIIVRRNGKIMVTGQSQQEPRIFAHFEDGDLAEAYIADPWVDFHDTNKAKLAEFSGREFTRKAVKAIGLGLLYGMGVNLLATKSGESVETAGFIKKAVMRLYPGLEDLYTEAKSRRREGAPFRTWGGRAFLCEPDSVVEDKSTKIKKIVQWDYKMPNAVIQGSAADCTKEAIIRFAAAASPGWHMVLQVHDEIVVSAPRAEAGEAMECLRRCMESIEFDIKMLSEGEWSAANWASMKIYDKRGEIVADLNLVTGG